MRPPEFHFPLFCPPGGRWPLKEEKTRPEPGYARMQNLAWIGPRVAEKSLTEQKNKQLVRQQDTYLAIRPAYPRRCCPRAAKGDKTYMQPVLLHR